MLQAQVLSGRMGIATDSRDENLKAKVGGGGGRVKVEAGAARAHYLDPPDAAIQSAWLSSRCHCGQPNGSPIFQSPLGESEISQFLIHEFIRSSTAVDWWLRSAVDDWRSGAQAEMGYRLICWRKG